ncbi:Crossover junction endodeoxyribonuclease RusA [Rubripirellula obstinata]|uniref:Crossover junction endodeoxyribonuclease RusA n=1 Tax=Rubripirellula obstinata TaxID=406547 RepID=A0A5B1CE23_9BACT|nr:RusA family crossover junction endodeoxyribonuclease [Rubripirellula obstinata]KAA1258115.1 Crossover junction endodeoxyribonuclease RusA [Rubripirellula obstinata]
MLKLKLPYPPTINHYWRHVGQRVLISKKGREYRAAVSVYLRNKRIETLEGPLSVDIELHMPDRRRRDIDNVLKAMLDSLQWGGAFLDDSQVMRLAIEKIVPEKKEKPKRRTKAEMKAGVERKVEKPEGKAIVWIAEIDTEQQATANRICLQCHQSFESTGPANRICGDCNQEQREMSPNAVPTWLGKRQSGRAL